MELVKALFSPAFFYFVAPAEIWRNCCDLTLFYSGPLGIKGLLPYSKMSFVYIHPDMSHDSMSSFQQTRDRHIHQ